VFKSIIAAAALAVAASTISGVTPASAADATANDTARILAGMAPAEGSALKPITEQKSWQFHAKRFDKAWANLEQRQLAKVRAWSEANLTNTEPTLIYTFSGPDYLYANAFFPKATTTIMAGLEPAGGIADLSKLSAGELSRELSDLEQSLNSVLSYSFFITRKMRTQLAGGKVRGTLPVLYVFLARSGASVDEMSYVNLDGKGGVVAADPAAKPEPGGVKIAFTAADGSKRTLYYFSTDLSNGGAKSTGFLEFAASFGPADAFVKSASYLMHIDAFSVVRDFLISKSTTLVQDDSGIPVRYLTPGWQFKAYGAYLGPIGLFHGKGQNEMKAVFKDHFAGNLDFGVGYRWHPRESNLLVAIKGEAPANQAAVTPAAPADASPAAAASAATAAPAAAPVTEPAKKSATTKRYKGPKSTNRRTNKKTSTSFLDTLIF
jgi:hypothetical protein